MNSYKKMILKSTLYICLLFSLFFTVTFYVERYVSAKNEYISTAERNLDSIMDKIESSMLQIQDLSILFPSNPDFKEYVESAYVSPYLQRTIVSYVHLTIGSLSGRTGTTGVTKPSDNYIITNDSIMSLNYFIYNIGLPTEEVREAIEASDKSTSPTPHIFFSSQEKNQEKKNYLTILLVDDSNFSAPYCIFTVYDLDTYLNLSEMDSSLLISSNGTPLWHSGEISENDMQKILENKSALKYSTVAKSTKMFPILGNLTCTLILPKTRYVQDIFRHLLFTAVSFLILFLLSLFISQKVSDRAYSPIQRLMDQISNIDTNTLENEIDAISSAISMLSRRNNTLSDMVTSSQSELKEKFVNDLLHGYMTDEQASYGIKSYLKDSSSALPLAIIVAECNSEIATIATEGSSASSLNLVISSMFASEFENEDFFHFSVLSPTCYCSVISCNDTDALKLRLQKLLLSIESELGFDMYASVSDYVEAWEDLPNAFFTTYFAHTNLKTREISRSVYSSDEIKVPIFYSYEIDNDIFTFCLRHEKDKLEKSLDFLVKGNFTTEKIFTERQAYISVLIFALCTRILASVSTDAEAVFGKDYNIYLELRSCRTIKDFRMLLSFIFINISEHIEKSQSVYEQDYTEAMLGYIQRNYNKDISLVDMAKYMNMSQSYVSRLFKKLTHSNFKDYLAQLRVEEAEKLLVEHPEKNISEIAAMLGFNTVKSFTSIFVKLANMTPTEYRRIHSKKNR